MTELSAEQHQRLTQAIHTLEKEVLGEVIVVVAKSSDSYRFIPTLCAALLALLLPGIFLVTQVILNAGWGDSTQDASPLLRVYMVQVAVFFGLLLAFHWPPVLRFIVPASVRRQRASRLAHEQFLTHGLHHTTERCGALIFISMLEHHIEILVDKGLAEHVSDAYWETTITRMSPLLVRSDIAGACHEAIESVAQTMHRHCPRDANTPKSNELPDHVIEL